METEKVDIKMLEEVAIVLRDLKPGDIIHIQVGVPSLGLDGEPWIPTQQDLDNVEERWNYLLPEGVLAIVTHFGENIATVKDSRDK